MKNQKRQSREQQELIKEEEPVVSEQQEPIKEEENSNENESLIESLITGVRIETSKEKLLSKEEKLSFPEYTIVEYKGLWSGRVYRTELSRIKNKDYPTWLV